jgi:hypothetical protein
MYCLHANSLARAADIVYSEPDFLMMLHFITKVS